MPLIHVIILAMLPDAKHRCKLVLDNGGDVNSRAGDLTPPIAAVSTGGQYDLAIFLLERGADATLPMENKIQKLIHCVVLEERDIGRSHPAQRASYERLLDLLIAQGEDAVAARDDLARWSSFSKIPAEFARQWKAEVLRKQTEHADRSPPSW